MPKSELISRIFAGIEMKFKFFRGRSQVGTVPVLRPAPGPWYTYAFRILRIVMSLVRVGKQEKLGNLAIFKFCWLYVD